MTQKIIVSITIFPLFRFVCHFLLRYFCAQVFVYFIIRFHVYVYHTYWQFKNNLYKHTQWHTHIQWHIQWDTHYLSFFAFLKNNSAVVKKCWYSLIYWTLVIFYVSSYLNCSIIWKKYVMVARKKYIFL